MTLVTSLSFFPFAEFAPQSPNEALENPQIPVRVVYLLTLNGRAVRQVRRLIKALFHRDHYFYIHVDAVSDTANVSVLLNFFLERMVVLEYH